MSEYGHDEAMRDLDDLTSDAGLVGKRSSQFTTPRLAAYIERIETGNAQETSDLDDALKANREMVAERDEWKRVAEWLARHDTANVNINEFIHEELSEKYATVRMNAAIEAVRGSHECEAKRYRKKPVVIEAMTLTQRNAVECAEWCGGKAKFVGKAIPAVFINTLEGSMRADVGDYIIRGVQGEFYPCKPGIFSATYEEEQP